MVKPFALIGLMVLLITMTGCRRDMYNQPRNNPLSTSDFFTNGAAARPLVAGTIPREHFDEDRTFYTGKTGIGMTNLVENLPVKLTQELLVRGQQRFEIYCAVCHGATGNGQGMIVQRGFPMPPTFHQPRLREAPIGHFYEVITAGYGVMYSYASRVEPADRWAIAAYIRALQLSQNMPVASLSSNELAQLTPRKP